ncbi:NAD(+)--dinitrogen-reductase ADP-D-ribosyltransferase [Skermanella stibiiresistens SB22]|uniref:NAD(+)--dinitrogen-reductase ADP-D-ribosyltransferase n=1 Tax=Skermanella stibiiresistens SB22 TaxID=1385369 RepID=W9H045_9PROT|nr:NAD(+)--dinitrogen-reductase ADP-D-ribosyltransferase [Skermanella stibiiresistens]EWY39444.1 NAD(+)--dinitrogen-reductase ADP-D-ribosyltransferase [Skermanella stibiiresistens SB22]
MTSGDNKEEAGQPAPQDTDPPSVDWTDPADEPAPVSQRQHRTNLLRVPTDLLGSTAFNDRPVPLHISGTRQIHAALFASLEETRTAVEAGDVFQAYMGDHFGISPDFSGSAGADGRKRFRSSYLRLLKGWMFDSNNAEGAVLKGWVESRFGLLPTFHKAPLRRMASDAWAGYLEQKLSTRFHNNMIHEQLDLLFEFCQWSVPRLFGPDCAHLTLYRGVNDFEEHHIVGRSDGAKSRRSVILRLNNLVSFTNDRDIAGQFGDHILEARVPSAKLVFFRDLLPRYPFQGEGEYLVVGGDYRVTASIF